MLLLLRLRAVLLTALVLALGPTATASTIILSDVSSDLTPASQLDATIDFVVGDFDGGNPGDEVEITLTNPAAVDGGDALFNINEIYWNAAANVVGLTLLSATHSADGDVLADWTPVETGSAADGFGTFEFALTDGTGEINPALVGPGENIVFILDIDGVGVSMTDFIEQNAMGYIGAAKFTNGPLDPESPGNEDSAFGAALPEPGTGLLFAIGCAVLGTASRRRL